MKKIYGFLFFSAFLISCSKFRVHIPDPHEYKYMYYGEEPASATIHSIREAGKKADEFPDETILNDEVEVTLNFRRNKEFDSSAFDKLAESARNMQENKDKIEKKWKEEFVKGYDDLKKGDYNRVRVFAETNESDMTENPIPDGEIFVQTNYEYEYTTLKDFISRPFVVSYNSMTRPYHFSFRIDDNIAEPKRNTEKNAGSSYFKTDAMVEYYDMSLPVRGTRVKVNYTEKCRDAKFKSMIYIQEDHFAEKKVIRIAQPDWLEFDIIEKNFEGIEYKKEVVEMSDQFVDEEDELSKTEAQQKISNQNKKSKTIAATTDKSKLEKTKYVVYTFRNLKPYQKYKSGRGASYNLPMLYFHYKSVKLETGERPLFETTDDLYRWYKSVTGTLQNDTSRFAAFTRELVKHSKTDEDKIRTVFYWIQDNIRYLAFEDGLAGFRPDECSNVYTKRYGDCKGMANLSRNMLKVLGFDARMVWIGTRHLNFSYEKPGLPVDNHAICAVRLNGGFVFLDATEKYCALGDYANRIQGRPCIVEDGDRYVIDTIPEFGIEHNEELTTEFIKLNADKLEVKGTLQFKGESKIEFLRDYNMMNLESRDELLFNYITRKQLSVNALSIATSDLGDRDADALVNYDLIVDNHAFTKNAKTYINLDWNRYFASFEFDSARNIDLSFGSKINIQRNVVFQLKDGQKVGILPETVKIDNPYYSFFLEIKQVGRTLVYKRSIITKEDYVPVNMLETLDKDSKRLELFYNSYIELI